METLFFMYVLSTVMGMRLCYLSKKAQLDGKEIPKWQNIALYVSALLFGALGIVIGIFLLDFERKNIKLLAISSFLGLAQLVFVLMILR